MLLAGATGIAASAIVPVSAAQAADTAGFDRLATFPVYLNSDASQTTAAEISAVTPDGKTLVYSDSPGKRLGFVDITDTGKPKPGGVLPLNGEPTSVAATGNRILAVVNTGADKVHTAGELVVLDAGSHKKLTTVQLGGQPDSIAVDKSGKYAVIAIENERDEELNGGDLPQLPAGFVAIVNLDDYSLKKVEVTGLADIAPQDPEPEYVSINSKGIAAVTLQENNHIVFIDVAKAAVTGDFSAGSVTLNGVDTKKDGVIDPSGTLTARREPDAVTWVGDGLIATANEGDWKGGSRDFTVFDTSGKVVYTAGASLEHEAIRHGLYPEDRSAKKGVEPEGIAYATFGGKPYLFVGAERGNFVAVYDMTTPSSPVFTQILPVTNGPEGLVAVPGRDLFVVSSETEDPAHGIRSTVSLYGFGKKAPSFPSIVAKAGGPQPLPWGTLSGLSADPAHGNRLFAVTDSAYKRTSILSIDVSATPALIDASIPVLKDGKPVGYDGEGIFARPGGGFWLASEGKPSKQVPNLLVRVNHKGDVEEEIPLPEAIAAGMSDNGLEGVTAIGTGADEVVWVALQRPVGKETATRLGRYEVAAKKWTWVSYELDKAAEGVTVGLSEITALDAKTLLVIERDNQRGPNAAVKRVYKVDVSTVTPVADGTLPAVSKKLAVDLLPRMTAGHGWTQDKVEGLAISGNGDVFAVTDNDAVSEATGETLFMRLGRASKLFGGPGGGDDGDDLAHTGTNAFLIALTAVVAAIVGGGMFFLARRRRIRGYW
ncbi:hypothetical protein Afil01_52230 [Actinorhabdospora filicis]|uniref:Phytase-like domain-containing protein n=2 Tax=Actinorhabdospora filicis TaxID=1785913 RepID=A0A9W6SQI2_9ACTN|nr:hypothetical protein Afil01_52230 [Actinorhabdospora filicis]